jgi:RHS repeat-associated protein
VNYNSSSDHGATENIIRDQQGASLGVISGGKSYIYLTANSGSVLTLVGSDGAYAWTPYEALAAKSAGSGGSLVTQNLIRYTGALTDTYTSGSTGYVHDGAGWYNPATGIFTGQDSNSYLANPANGNRYAYAADNPANNTDPTGMCSGFVGCLEAVAGYALGVGGSAGLIGGVVGCIATGGPADFVACPAGFGVGAAVGGIIGFLSGLEFGILVAVTGRT